ncbi:helix-turn-helix domain-containing protein [Vallitalea guaymasensis]|uniref:helix-turn-helix domain-containing protein n=1 Tax=Vallitalea guaymasensis TaxID=1185412 RepID=UPI000DE1B8F6|nr:helix-turn-helix transcriptional regulator [Vallitalea guaymasensis]
MNTKILFCLGGIIIFEGFGERLKECLKNAGYTNKMAIEELGLSQNAITNYIKGRLPKTQILYQLSHICDVSIEYLLTGNDTNMQLDEQTKLLLKFYNKLDKQNKKLAVHELKYMYEKQELKKED